MNGRSSVDMAVPVSPSELSIKRQAFTDTVQNNGPAYPTSPVKIASRRS
ncbi:MAG: hypothetical protein ACLU4N_00415 [Butyricimonas faecihominis]